MESIPKNYIKIIFAQKQRMKKMPLFDQNHGLTPLENTRKCDSLKCIFYNLETTVFSPKDPLRLFQDHFPQKQKMKIGYFLTKITG